MMKKLRFFVATKRIFILRPRKWRNNKDSYIMNFKVYIVSPPQNHRNGSTKSISNHTQQNSYLKYI